MPVKMVSVNKFSTDFTVTKMPEQLIYSDSFYSYLNAGPRATPHWVGLASRSGLQDPESRDPVPDAETLGLGVRYRTPRHFLLQNCGYTRKGSRVITFNFVAYDPTVPGTDTRSDSDPSDQVTQLIMCMYI